MGGGDLNMKKSWFPGLIKNRKEVWEAQQAARLERQRGEQVRKEIEQERQAAELQRLSELAGAPKKQKRVEFLYAGGGVGQAAIEQEREAYLLGKKRIDDVLGKDMETAAAPGGTIQSDSINLRDLNNKISLDPLLAIKRQEAAQVEAMVAKAKAEAAAQRRVRTHNGHADSRRERSRERHRSRRDDSRDYHSRRDSERHSRRDSRERHSRHDSRNHHSRNDSRERHSRHDSDRHSRRRRGDSRDRLSRRDARSKSPIAQPDDRAAKLSAMTSAASDLDNVRAARLAQMAQREADARKSDSSARMRGPSFVRDMQLNAGVRT